MSIFAVVTVSNEIELPHFPEEIDRDDLQWQSKEGIDRYGGPYRITADGRLEKKKTSYREKTDEEKQAEAETWGFDSWEEMKRAYDEVDDGSLFPESIDYDRDEDGYEDHPPTYLTEETTDETWWADHNMHGTFEFHQIIRRDPTDHEELEITSETIERPSDYALDVFLEYEARFDKGDLSEIVFMGERHTSGSDSVQSALDKIEDWREWKASDASGLDEGDSE